MTEAEQLQWLEQHGATVEFKREFVKVRVEVGMSHAFNVRGNTLLTAIIGIQQLQEGYDRASRQRGQTERTILSITIEDAAEQKGK